MSSEALNASVSTIVTFNDGLADVERSEHAKTGHIAAVTKHPDLYRMGGLKGSAKLWSKPGQKERHARRLMDLNSKGFMVQEPNKLEQKFWDMIGADRITFVSFKFWKTIATDRGYMHITPDFRIPGTTAVIEVYGDYWHAGEDPASRIAQWASVGCMCLVVWEHEINKNSEATKAKVEAFISQNLHECAAPTINQVG
jgi:very-short-patch-repair endonuclease